MEAALQTVPSSAGLTLEEARLLLTECQNDPLFFVREVLGITATEDQEAGMLAIRDFKRVAIRSGNDLGKTALLAMALLWFGFCFRPCIIITTAAVGRQVKSQIWGEARKFYRNARYHLGGKLQPIAPEWKICEGSFALGFTAADAERFQGWHAAHILFILDEAIGLPRAIFDGAEGSMSGGHARMLVASNPLRPEGEFYRCFKSPSWTCLKIAAERHPNIIEGREVIAGGITREWMESRKADWGESDPRYIARVLGEFPESSEDVLVLLAWLEAARAREIPEQDDDSLKMGVDVARYGADKTVHIIRDDAAVRHIESHVKESTMQTAGRTKALAERWKIKPRRVFVDDTGVGGGVTDRLHEQGFDITPVNNGGKAQDAKYFANVRAETHWKLREALDPDYAAGSLIIPAGSEYDALAAEISQLRYSLTSKGQIKLESKDEIKKRLGRSPDYADALAETYAVGRPEPRATVL